jgi:adenylate cyclase class 2
MNEIEVKFKIKDTDKLVEKLTKMKGKRLEEVYQKTFNAFKPDYSCVKQGIFLRARIEGFVHTMTIKIKPKKKTEYFERKEYELIISDVRVAIEMFKALGYTKIRTFEKYRTVWTFKNRKVKVLKVLLDKLPIGDYVEIEGTKKEIERMIKDLGLDGEKRIIVSYWHLYEQKTGDKEGNMLFKQNERHN